jgi:acetyl-CoA carboxylase biotin carboxyl carrier protein
MPPLTFAASLKSSKNHQDSGMADPRKPAPRAGSTARPAAKSPPVKDSPKESTAPKPRKTTMADSDDAVSGGNVFDVARIRQLVELMKEHDLNEIDLRESRHRIRIQRGAVMQAMTYAPQAQYAPPPMVTQAPTTQPTTTGGNSVAMEGPNIVTIKSPMVGTFYSKANPKANPFVKVGDRVDTNTTVCIVEAMKVFNEIPAEVRGTIVAVLAEENEPVEFDKPLFKVDTSK